MSEDKFITADQLKSSDLNCFKCTLESVERDLKRIYPADRNVSYGVSEITP